MLILYSLISLLLITVRIVAGPIFTSSLLATFNFLASGRASVYSPKIPEGVFSFMLPYTLFLS